MTSPSTPKIPADTTIDVDLDPAASYNFARLRQHLYEVHRNTVADGLTDAEAVDQHHHEHHGPGGLRLHGHPDDFPPTRWEKMHPPQADTAVEGPRPDIITMDRKIGVTQASVTLMSGAVVSGDRAAGDCQALRRLVEALVKMTDDAVGFSARVNRGNSNLNADNRDLRDQLVAALNEVNELHLAREHWIDQTGRIGQLMAEITTLKAARPDAEVDPEVSHYARRLAALTRDHDILRGAAAADKARADANEARVQELARQLAAAHEAEQGTVTRSTIQRQAVDAAMAADRAFKEEAWKTAGRLMKLASMWTSLLAVADFPQEAPPTEPGSSKWP